jgi:hypothetical protein
MRASQENGRPRPWRRLAAGAATAMLALSLIGGGTASAATPDWSMAVTPLPASVSPGAVAGYRVVVTNNGTSNISQVFLTNALDTIDPTIVPAASADPYAILPIAYVSASQGQCDPVDTVAPIDPVILDCALGAIRSHRSATVVVAYQTDVAWAQLRVIFEANTTGVAGDNQGSSHGDVRQGVGTTQFHGSADFAGAFVLAAGAAVANSQGLGVANLQSTKVNVPGSAIPVTVADGADAAPITCPTITPCWSETSEIHVNNGASFPSGFSVEIGVYKDLAQTVHSVYHQFDAPINDIAGETLDKCPKKGPPSNCFTVVNAGGGNILVTVWLDVNGSIRFN